MSDSDAFPNGPPPPGPWQLPAAQLQWSDDGEPRSGVFDDIYFSRGDGRAETDYVFLRQNRLEQRWRALDPAQPGLFVIGETGFGTGLNLFCAWQLWRRCAPPSWRLLFLSTERFPLARDALQQAWSQWQATPQWQENWPEFAALGGRLLETYPERVPGFHRRALGDGVSLQLLFGDAAESFRQLHDSAAAELDNGFRVDAWFLDGFAPAKNPQMWSDELFWQLGRLSRAGTTVSTFTVAGSVRRGLQQAGFAIEKVEGFGSKRQMLRGDFVAMPATHAVAPDFAPRAIDYWAYPAPVPAASHRHAIVIGGGLAGTSSARALAERGWSVTLLECADTLAAGASGNAQGVLYTKLSAQAGTLNRFTLASYLHAVAFYRELLDEDETGSRSGARCGVLQFADSDEQWRQLRAAFAGHDDWVRCVDAAEAAELAHCALPSPALWFPRAGWLAPARLCASQAAHPAIDVRLNCGAQSLRQHGDGWLVDTAEGPLIGAVAIIANAHAATTLAQTAALPLRAIRGQVSELPSRYLREQPASVICHEGYLAPAPGGAGIHLGATFDLDEFDTALRPLDHLRNLRSLQRALPELLAAAPDDIPLDVLAGRAGLRCTTPDYLPIAGPVADNNAMLARFGALAKNARAAVALPGAYLPGLYVNVGHGSRGLTSTPLCAELLACLITGEPRPLPRDLVQALSPARFLLRALSRGGAAAAAER